LRSIVKFTLYPPALGTIAHLPSQDIQLHPASQDIAHSASGQDTGHRSTFTGLTVLSGFTGFFVSHIRILTSHISWTSFIEEKGHTIIDLSNRLHNLDKLQVQIQQLIKNYGKNFVERRHRDGYYSGKPSQLNDLRQQFFDLDEEVQQAAFPTGDEYAQD